MKSRSSYVLLSPLAGRTNCAASGGRWGKGADAQEFHQFEVVGLLSRVAQNMQMSQDS
jgi:hypothetical protein